MTEHAVGEHAVVRVDGATAVVELVGARSMNVLGTPMMRDLTAAVESVAARGDVRVVVLRGHGDRAFMGGADIAEMVELDRTSGERFIRSLAALCDALLAAPQPIVARLSGWCLGGGLEVALACDLRVAADSATLGMPEVTVGIPSVIHSAMLPRLVGESRAAWLLLTGATVDAVTAERWGLVGEVVAADRLDARIDELTARLSSCGPQALAAQKRLLRRWRTMSVQDAIEDSVAEFGRAVAGDEPRRFMRAFLDRDRDPS